MARMFAYIVHSKGVPDDTAAELLAAGKKIDAAQSPTAVVAGNGEELDSVCEALRPRTRRSGRSLTRPWLIRTPRLFAPRW